MIPFLDQPHPGLSWALATLAVVVVGIDKSGFGGGVGIVAIPMFVLAMGSQAGLATLLPLLIAADVLSVYHHWGTWDRRNLVLLMPGTLVGILIGDQIMGKIDARGLELAVGLICLIYFPFELVRNRFAAGLHFRPNLPVGTLSGVLAGTASTLAHAGGPFFVVFLLGQRLLKQTFIGTAVFYFFLVNSIKLVPYGRHGLIRTDTLWQGLWLVPLVPVGTWLGSRLVRFLSEKLFHRVILVLLFLSSFQLVVGRTAVLRFFERQPVASQAVPASEPVQR